MRLQSSAFDGKRDPGTLVAVDLYIYKGRHADQIDLAGLQIAARDGHRLDGLVDGTRTDCLEFRGFSFTQYCRERACDRVGIALRRDLEDACRDLLCRIVYHAMPRWKMR